VLRAAGGRTNDFLDGDGLLAGNRIVAGPLAVYEALDDASGRPADAANARDHAGPGTSGVLS